MAMLALVTVIVYYMTFCFIPRTTLITGFICKNCLTASGIPTRRSTSKIVNFLSYKLTPARISSVADNLKVGRDALPPKIVHQVRQFIKLRNLFRSLENGPNNFKDKDKSSN
jgi:hypothetical protein